MSTSDRVHLVKSRRPHKVGMVVPPGGSNCAKCRFLVNESRDGRRGDCSLAMWVDAPKREGGGGGDPRIPVAPDRWCCDGYEPRLRGTFEGVNRSRRNPADLLSYQSKVAVGGGGLSPLESTFVLGGLLVVAGLVTYAMLKPWSAAPPVQPIPLPQPVNPAQPGY